MTKWLVLVSLFSAKLAGAGAGVSVEISEGRGSFAFVDDGGPAVTVWTYRPSGLRPTSKIVFVIHGVNRDARRYRDQWQPHAERYGFLLVVPELDERSFPSRAFQRGNVVGEDGDPLDRSRWTFSLIERLFDAVRSAARLHSGQYSLYGHSAGGQFVHRFALFMPDSRCERAVAANAGWYTVPDFDVDYPYGLRGAPATESSVKAALGRDLVILLGGDDVDASDPDLRDTERARVQGLTRLERGRYLYDAAQRIAQELSAPFRWRLIVVPGAAHSNQAMAESAAVLLAR